MMIRKNRKASAIFVWLFTFITLTTISEIFFPLTSFAADDIAIDGYDPVAYFTLNKATRGDKEFFYSWNGDTWHFDSKEHKDLFAANPQKYAPQFNGFCANGLSDGHVIDGDPENWRIIDGKLYLFFSEFGRDQWSGNVKPLIQKAGETLKQN